MKGFTLRRLGGSDLRVLEKIAFEIFYPSSLVAREVMQSYRLYFKKGHGNRKIEKSVDDWISIEYYVLVEDKTKRIVGITGLYRINWGSPDSFWLGWFGVDKAFRGRGLGTELLAMTERIAKERGAKYFCIESSDFPANQHAAKLYTEMDYKKFGPIPNYWPGFRNERYGLVIFIKKL
ncbi:TPA: GNAT family N-acetyltransferase [archaeon]|uniref:GNAT family N-acetyltransferase n=1 Tax=Candidatus Naiadarchaeum limnaeum TaxID=2756139 RepID=A0A832V338_9ARCH|nr:GNAT family N-acetyltransferase [Candidatus Naiadarchaeum limnaeum]